MVQSQAMEERITRGLGQLVDLLAQCSTYTVAGTCLTKWVFGDQALDSPNRMISPAKQIPFLLSVLLSTEEPAESRDFTEDDWNKCKEILHDLFTAYMDLYLPDSTQAGEQSTEWQRTREVSMLAFLHYYNSGTLASVEQIKRRITDSVVPFDAAFERQFGITISDALNTCTAIGEMLQAQVERAQQAGKAARKAQTQVEEEAERRGIVEMGALGELSRELGHLDAARVMMEEVAKVGVVELAELRARIGESADAFWKLFTCGRGEAPRVRYPTERSAFETRPLIRVNSERAVCVTINSLFEAVLTVGEEALASNDARDAFLKNRDRSLERQVTEQIESLFVRSGTVLSTVFEISEGVQFEHDVVGFDDQLCLVVEAKASPPREPFRDPDKAFPRLRDAFRADTGIQKAFEQGNRLVRRLNNGEGVELLDSTGNKRGEIPPSKSRLNVSVVVTRDSFGGLATNLTLLLQKDAGDAYPWVINIIDLGNFLELWKYFKWGTAELREYLESRLQLHGKIFSDDELDFAGFFVRHGRWRDESLGEGRFTVLAPEYSSVFDQVYRHIYGGGPPVTIERVVPVLTDLRQSLQAEQADARNEGSMRVGRNAPCPCGSGKKYKRCCGAVA